MDISGARASSDLGAELELEELIRELFTSQRFAVLGTQSRGQPYANLVAFTASADLKSLFFATARATRKYANIEADARVTVLVENRSNQDSDFSKAAAVTATGRAEELPETEREEVLKNYLKKHPMLSHLLPFLHFQSQYLYSLENC